MCEKSQLHFIVGSILSEGLGKRVVVDLELSYLIVLVSGNTDEGAFNQVIGEDDILVFLGDKLGDDQARLVLVHGVEGHHL